MFYLLFLFFSYNFFFIYKKKTFGWPKLSELTILRIFGSRKGTKTHTFLSYCPYADLLQKLIINAANYVYTDTRYSYPIPMSPWTHFIPTKIYKQTPDTQAHILALICTRCLLKTKTINVLHYSCTFLC